MDVAVVRKAVDTIRRSNGSRRVGPTTAATNTAGARTRIHWICNMRGGIMANPAYPFTRMVELVDCQILAILSNKFNLMSFKR